MSDGDRDFSAVADPALIERLAAWFGDGPPPAPPDPETLEQRARESHIAALEAATDEELRSRLTGQADASARLLTFSRTPLTSVIDEHLSIARFPLGPLLERDEGDEAYEQPDDIGRALREDSTPQSLLRDLYRLVHHFRAVYYEEDSEPLGCGMAAGSLARQVMAEMREFEPPPEVPALIEQDLGELRSRLSEPWEESAVDPQVLADRATSRLLANMEAGFDPDL